MPNPQVYFEVIIGDRKVPQRLIMTLYADSCPKTAENFRCLCTGEKKSKAGKPLHYKGSFFHRIIEGFMAQGGDFMQGNGQGGDSIYGGPFPDENFKHTHSHAGMLSMANTGPNTNRSQFFITTAPTPWLNGKHVVFGHVILGMNTLSAIDCVGRSDGIPFRPVQIAGCGQLKGKQLQTVLAPGCKEHTSHHSPRIPSPMSRSHDPTEKYVSPSKDHLYHPWKGWAPPALIAFVTLHHSIQSVSHPIWCQMSEVFPNWGFSTRFHIYDKGGAYRRGKGWEVFSLKRTKMKSKHKRGECVL